MRKLWQALAILGVVNLALLSALLTWMITTGRMDAQRFAELRSSLGRPAAEVRAEEEAARAEATRQAEREVELARLGVSPRTSAERVADVDRALDHRQLQKRLVEEEARRLGGALDERRTQLDHDSANISARKSAFDQARAADEATRKDVQFRKTTALLEAAPPKQAKEWIAELVKSGRRTDAVRYLDAMTKLAANRILREMKSAEETALAADLLDGLRQLSPGREDPSVNAPDSSR